MGLVYRVIPIPEVSYMEQGYKGTNIQSPEKDFYDLGYLDFPKNIRYFRFVRGSNTFGFPETETKAFFLFPMDALFASKGIDFFDSWYTSSSVWLCEYEIPNDILIKYAGVGYYKRIVLPEFQIPLDALCPIESVMTECDEAMIAKLRNRYQRNLEEYAKTSLDLSNEQTQGKFNCLLEKFDQNFEARIGEKKGIFFPSNIITGRSFIAKRSDIDKALYEEKEEPLMLSSNGIITKESLASYYAFRKQVKGHSDYTEIRVDIPEYLNAMSKECVKKKVLVKPQE